MNRRYWITHLTGVRECFYYVFIQSFFFFISSFFIYIVIAPQHFFLWFLYFVFWGFINNNVLCYIILYIVERKILYIHVYVVLEMLWTFTLVFDGMFSFFLICIFLLVDHLSYCPINNIIIIIYIKSKMA